MARSGTLRWRFPDASEEAERARTIALVDDWWRAFAENAPRIVALFHRTVDWDLGAWMRDHLQVVDPRLMWEFGPATRGTGHRLVITPEADRQLRPLVEVLLSRAPALDDWEFHAYRPPDPFEGVCLTVRGRTGTDVSKWTAHAEPGPFGLVDVFLAPPRSLFGDSSKNDAEAAFVATEGTVGEEVLDTWIGEIRVERRKEAGLLADLAARVSALVEDGRTRLPAEAYRRRDSSKWSLLKLQPEKADDYVEQWDLFVAKAMDLDLWKATHAPLPFDSRRFSRSNETFCYLKTDGSRGLPADGFVDKAEIEDAIDSALLPRGLGCHIGGGTGLRYSYVDLALTDVDTAVATLLPVLRAGKLPPRSWILFFDAKLAGEWIPIWPDSPSPP